MPARVLVLRFALILERFGHLQLGAYRGKCGGCPQALFAGGKKVREDKRPSLAEVIDSGWQSIAAQMASEAALRASSKESPTKASAKGSPSKETPGRRSVRACKIQKRFSTFRFSKLILRRFILLELYWNARFFQKKECLHSFVTPKFVVDTAGSASSKEMFHNTRGIA